MELLYGNINGHLKQIFSCFWLLKLWSLSIVLKCFACQWGKRFNWVVNIVLFGELNLRKKNVFLLLFRRALRAFSNVDVLTGSIKLGAVKILGLDWTLREPILTAFFLKLISFIQTWYNLKQVTVLNVLRVCVSKTALFARISWACVCSIVCTQSPLLFLSSFCARGWGSGWVLVLSAAGKLKKDHYR